MHPIFQNRLRTLLYVLAWMAVGIVYAVELSNDLQLDIPATLMYAIPHALLLAFIASSAWYWCKTFPLRKTPLLRVLGSQAVAALVSVGIWTATGALYFDFLFSDHAFPWMVVFTGGKIFLFITVLLFYLAIEFDYARSMEKRATDLQLQNREAQLRALRMQINPHFLFNSLNSISALTSQDPKAARSMTILLADFFRNSLKWGEMSSIPLREEIGLARQYLEIEKLRFGSRLDLVWQTDPATESIGVPPLILQPLVENAIKHGIAPLAEGGRITIAAQTRGTMLTVVVTNPIDTTAISGNGSLVGLQNVRNRLRALYGGEARLDVKTDTESFSAALHIPTEVARD